MRMLRWASIPLIPLLAIAASVAAPTAAGAQVMDDAIFWKLTADELEYSPGPAGQPIVFDGSFWIGGDYNRFWIKAEAERATVGDEAEMEVQALYSRLIAPFWEAQAGIGMERVTGEASHTRALLVLGLEGLAPHWFEVEPQLLVSQEGDIAFSLSAAYDLLFTQRLILEPEIELAAAVQEVPEFGVGSGLNDIHLGARLRYEIRREIAPYLGVVWGRSFGGTADLVRAEGGETSEVSFVAGLRVWY